MSYGELRHYAEFLGVNVSSAVNIGNNLIGIFDLATNTIILERNATYRQKKCALAHELVHWYYGDEDGEHILKAKAETRTRHVTARLLINSSEYAKAEELYDGEIGGIAEELDVTPQVVRDYQELLDTDRLKAARVGTVPQIPNNAFNGE